MKFRKILSKVVVFIMVVCIMAGGAWGIYTIKYEHPIERIEEMLSSNIADAIDDAVLAVKEKIPTAVTTASQPATQYVMNANAGGEIDNSNLTEQEKGYDEYIKNLETSSAEETSSVIERTSSEPDTTVKEKNTTTVPTEPATTEKITTTTVKVSETTTRQPETATVKERETTPAPTTTAKKQGKVVTDEKIRAAMIQLGYDPDNYVASDLTTAEITAILRLARGEATSVPAERMEDAVDYSQRTLEYDGPELPKPMG